MHTQWAPSRWGGSRRGSARGLVMFSDDVTDDPAFVWLWLLHCTATGHGVLVTYGTQRRVNYSCDMCSRFVGLFYV